MGWPRKICTGRKSRKQIRGLAHDIKYFASSVSVIVRARKQGPAANRGWPDCRSTRRANGSRCWRDQECRHRRRHQGRWKCPSDSDTDVIEPDFGSSSPSSGRRASPTTAATCCRCEELDLINREADIALRLTRPDKGDRVIARRLGQFAYAVYGPASPRRSPLPWITQDVLWSSLPHVRWMAEAIKREPQAGAPLIVNDSELAVHAVGAGLGRSLLPCCIGDRENNLSRLNDQEPVTRELWLLVHPDLKHLARTRAVIAWIERVAEDLERSTRHTGKRRR